MTFTYSIWVRLLIVLIIVIRLNYRLTETIGTLTWTEIDVPPPKPAPRNTHTAVLLGDGLRLAIFGGRDEHKFFNDCWVLDIRTRTNGFPMDLVEELNSEKKIGNFTWERVATTGSVPSPRSGHSAVLVREHSILVFGGWGGGFRRFGDLHELDLSACAHLSSLFSWKMELPTVAFSCIRYGRLEEA